MNALISRSRVKHFEMELEILRLNESSVLGLELRINKISKKMCIVVQLTTPSCILTTRQMVECFKVHAMISSYRYHHESLSPKGRLSATCLAAWQTRLGENIAM